MKAKDSVEEKRPAAPSALFGQNQKRQKRSLKARLQQRLWLYGCSCGSKVATIESQPQSGYNNKVFYGITAHPLSDEEVWLGHHKPVPNSGRV